MRFRMQQAVVLGTLLVSMGCYTLHPIVGQTLPLGSQVALSINDAGRASLGGQMGPEIAVIQGRLLQKDSTEFVLAVAQIELLRGGEQVWSGERIRVKNEFVNSVSERRFSRGKTALVGAATAGVLAIIFSQGILGNLAGSEGKTPPDSGVSSRIPRFVR